MRHQQPVTLAPASGLVQVQRLLASVAVPARSDGLGLVDPALWDQKPLGQEALPLDRFLRLLQGAVEHQQLLDRSLPLAEDDQHKGPFTRSFIHPLPQTLSVLLGGLNQ